MLPDMALPSPIAPPVALDSPDGAVADPSPGRKAAYTDGPSFGKKRTATPIDISARDVRGVRIQPAIVIVSG